ncbi:EF-hand domain-containing protein [bacterium]|nr:EF-hand domain-containing protein [bacterium]
MDLSGVSSNTDIVSIRNNKLNSKTGNNQSPASKIVLAKKGSPAFMKQFDTDNDGQITLEEFNNYCEENGISEKDKAKILQVMQLANSNSKVVSANINKDEKTEKIDEKMVYAKKGDEKYNEEMDTNKNGVITYAEYIQYLQKHNNNSNETNDLKEDMYIAKNIAPEVESTVEYEG